MIDDHFRRILPSLVAPLTRVLGRLGLTPNQVTVLAFLAALLAAALVLQGGLLAACFVWWFSRLLDAMDGILARATGRSSDFGGFLDIQLDMAAYSAMVIALYYQFPEFALQWLVILFCYVLCISGALGLGSFETRKGIKDSSQRRLRLASGLAEGGETGIAYTIFLLLPQFLSYTSWLWILVLAVTIIARLRLAWTELAPDQP